MTALFTFLRARKALYCLPNSEDNIAYIGEDLSRGAELKEEDRELIAPEENDDYLDPTVFDIGIFIGDNLTNLRTMHGYSRKHLIDMLGVTEQAVWQYENNYTSPKMKTVKELKKSLM